MLLRDMIKKEELKRKELKQEGEIDVKSPIKEETIDPSSLDADERFKVSLKRLKKSNPRLYKKIIGLD